MSQSYTKEEALASIKPTYFVVYLSLQLAAVVFLTYLGNSPLVLSYAVALMAMRYAMTKLTDKYKQAPSIGFHPEFIKFVSLANVIITAMMLVASDFNLSLVNLIGVFIFLMVFSAIGVYLEQWFTFIRGIRKSKK